MISRLCHSRVVLGAVLILPAFASFADPAPEVKWTFDCGSRIYSGPVAAELSARPGLELLVVLSNERKVVCLDAERNLLWSYDAFALRLTDAPTVADLDGDGAPEIFWKSRAGLIECHGADGAKRWELVFYEPLIMMVCETLRESATKIKAQIRLPQQQRPRPTMRGPRRTRPEPSAAQAFETPSESVYTLSS